MPFKRLFLGATLALLANCAFADGPQAAHDLFANLGRAGKTLRVTEQDAFVTRTLVRGMYTLVDAKGEFVTFLNEDGTLYGDKNGLFAFPKHGAAPQRMTVAQLAAFRLELVAAIDRDSLIMVMYGNGGARERTVLFSAIDCPGCHELEKNLGQAGRNETLYIVPSSISKAQGEGAAEWENVAKIWCAKDSASAWRNYMVKRAVPAARPCAFSDPQVARTSWNWLYSILRDAGLTVANEPGFVFENGSSVSGLTPVRAPASPSAITAKWLPTAYPPSPPMGWSADAFRPQPVKVARR